MTLGRRVFLRGAGGFALALPFLPSLLGSTARADGATPRRFIGVMSINGQFRGNYHPDLASSRVVAPNVSATTTAPVSPLLGPHFDAVRSKLSVLLGLDGVTRGGHNRAFPLTASTHTGGGTDRDSAPYFPWSVDAILERSAAVYPESPVLGAMRLGPMRPPASASGTRTPESFSWWTEGGITTRLPYQWDARVVFNSLFGGGEVAEDPTAVDPRARRRLVIDRVIGDYQRVRASSRLAMADRHRLDNFTDHLRDLDERLGRAATITCDGPPLRDGLAMETLYSNHIDLLVAAMACDITRVGCLMLKHCQTSGEDGGYHANSHLENSAAMAVSLGYNTWVGQRVAELLSKLDSITEPDGTTLLDNSAVLWGNEIGHGGAHSLFDVPLVVAGSLGGRVRTGLTIDYRKVPAVEWANAGERLGRPYNQLLTTLMTAMGLDRTEWELAGTPGFGDYQQIGHRYSFGAWDEYVGRERELLPHYHVG